MGTDKKTKCLKENSVRTLQNSRQCNWKKLFWKTADEKRARETTGSERLDIAASERTEVFFTVCSLAVIQK